METARYLFLKSNTIVMFRICEAIDDLYLVTFGGKPSNTLEVFQYLTERQRIDLHAAALPDLNIRVFARLLTFERKDALQRLGL